jgi:hypothetical protein
MRSFMAEEMSLNMSSSLILYIQYQLYKQNGRLRTWHCRFYPFTPVTRSFYQAIFSPRICYPVPVRGSDDG